MSAPPAAGFLGRLLLREGAEVERDAEERLFVVLPAAVGRALSLPEAASLRVEGDAMPGETPFPLEGAGMQWCLDRAMERGRLAGARLALRAGTGHSRLAELERRTSLLNATRGGGSVVLADVVVALLEFSYEARSEERATGSVYLAADVDGGVASFSLAEALRAHVPHASPDPVTLPADALRRLAETAMPVAQEVVTRSLDSFRRQCLGRLLVERSRVVDYHDRLVREAGSRRRSALGVNEAEVTARREAILRQREERLRELTDRHAVEATLGLASVLLVRYEAAMCRLVVRRRQREIPFVVRWDPVLADFIGPPCSACSRPTLAVSACDAAGHLTCAACSARCPRCARAPCRACESEGCGCN